MNQSDIVANFDDTPEQLRKKLDTSNQLLARAYADILSLREATGLLGFHASYLVQLRRQGLNALALGHIDVLDLAMQAPAGQVH